MKRHGSANEGRWLEVRVRTTVGGEGETGRKLSVFCDRRGQSMEVTDCVSCVSCSGFRIDETGRESFLRCDGVAARPPGGGPEPSVSEKPPIAAVMTPAVVCVRPDLDIESLVALMIEHNISAVPVVNHAGQPVGMVSKTDVVQEFGRRNVEEDEPTQPLRMKNHGIEVELPAGFHLERMRNSTVGDIMTPMVFTLEETASLARAAGLMGYEGVHSIVITGDGGEVVGILSALDVVRWLAREAGYVAPVRHHGH